MWTSPRTARHLGPIAAVVALVATACTTSVTGAGRPAVAASGRPSASASPAASPAGTDVPSGAPTPRQTNYGDQTPVRRSYLYASDLTVGIGAVTATGTTVVDGTTVSVTATFTSDDRSETTGSCTFGLAGASAEVRAVGETLVARGPAAFWTAAGETAGVAAQAANRWVAVTDDGLPLVVCESTSFLLFASAPGPSAVLEAGTENGGKLYTVTESATGYTTVIDHDSGRIVGVRSSAGTLALAFPGTTPAAATLPAASEIVSVPGI